MGQTELFRIMKAASHRNLSSGFPTRSGTNRSVRPQKMVRGLEFRILEVEDRNIYVAKTKAPISCNVTAQLICASLFSAQIMTTLMFLCVQSTIFL